MSDLDHLFALFDAYANERGLSESRVSTLVFGAGHKIKSLRAGRDIGVRQLGQKVAWFSANWPSGLSWPSDIPRPLVGEISAPADPEPTPTGGAGLSDLTGRSMVDAPDIPEGAVLDPALVERVTDRATS